MPDCPECHGTGMVWPHPERCTCYGGDYLGIHERYCGAEPCPSGCPFSPPELEAS